MRMYAAMCSVARQCLCHTYRWGYITVPYMIGCLLTFTIMPYLTHAQPKIKLRLAVYSAIIVYLAFGIGYEEALLVVCWNARRKLVMHEK